MFQKTQSMIYLIHRCAPGFHMMGGDEAMETYEICMGANLTCMNDLMNRMGESKKQNNNITKMSQVSQVVMKVTQNVTQIMAHTKSA